MNVRLRQPVAAKRYRSFGLFRNRSQSHAPTSIPPRPAAVRFEPHPFRRISSPEQGRRIFRLLPRYECSNGPITRPVAHADGDVGTDFAVASAGLIHICPTARSAFRGSPIVPP